MSELNKEELEFRKQVKQKVASLAELEEKYKLALYKIAALKKEADVYTTVIDLISKGIIDAFEGPNKVKEYLKDASGFRIVKEASESGIPVDIFGSLTDITPKKGEESAEETFKKNIMSNDYKGDE